MRHSKDLRQGAGNFGERLLYVKRLDNLTWSDISRRSGVSVNMLCGCVSGRRTPNLYSAVAIARALNVSLDWLSGLED